MEYSKKLVIAIVALNVLFTIAVFVCFWHTGNEPSALIVAWFAFTTGELWCLSKIKTKKIENESEVEHNDTDY